MLAKVKGLNQGKRYYFNKAFKCKASFSMDGGLDLEAKSSPNVVQWILVKSKEHCLTTISNFFAI